MIIRLDEHRVVRGDSAKVAGHANREMERRLAVTSTLDTTATQADRIPLALEAGPGLDPGIISPEQQIQIWKRKHLIARQVIEILTAEVRELKVALERRAAA
jgi:hypothetical protein